MTVALDVTSRIAAAIRDVPDFPKQGIVFKDITPVLLDPRLFREATEAMAAPFAGHSISHVVAIESRGFILGAPVAQVLGAAFVPFRKRCDDAADALERVAARIRSGDLFVPGALSAMSDEAVLAAVLAALLQRARG